MKAKGQRSRKGGRRRHSFTGTPAQREFKQLILKILQRSR